MARIINLTTPECGVTNGMELSFRAPCNCTDVTGVSLEGVTYALVDASGNSLTSCSGYFAEGAILTVIIDTENTKATLLNPRVNTYTKTLGTPDDTASATGGTVWARLKQIVSDLAGKASAKHTHTKTEITDFAHNHDDRYYTEGEVNTKLEGKSNTGHTHTKLDITDFGDHNHDDRYYTESEIDSKLAGKSNSGHQHSQYATTTNLNKVIDGTTPIAKATSATQDGDGNVITDTYATKESLSNGAVPVSAEALTIPVMEVGTIGKDGVTVDLPWQKICIIEAIFSLTGDKYTFIIGRHEGYDPNEAWYSSNCCNYVLKWEKKVLKCVLVSNTASAYELKNVRIYSI